MFRRKRKGKIQLHISKRVCIGCEKCVDRCRHKVLGMVYKEEESYASLEYPQRCTGCQKCVRNCPVGAIEIFEKEVYRIE